MADDLGQIEKEFHKAMLGIYDAALRLRSPYRPTAFRKMVVERGGRNAANALLDGATPSAGFTELFMRGRRLDLSVEYLVLNPRFQPLFTEEQLDVARARLTEHQFDLPAAAKPALADPSVAANVIDSSRNYWWVNQNQTHQAELAGGYLWSPKRKSNGHKNNFYETMREVAPGDMVFSFAGTRIIAIGHVRSYCREHPKPDEFGVAGANWSSIGWYVGVEFVELKYPIRPKDLMERLRPTLPESYSPLSLEGDGYQHVYLARLPAAMASVLVQELAAAGNAVPNPTVTSPDFVHESEATRQIEEQVESSLFRDSAIPETEKKQIVLARRGQGRFRDAITDRRCRITGLAEEAFLVASHIKPWRHATNEERLDGDNGLLLAPHVDLLFDRGFISFASDGTVIISPVLPAQVLKSLRIEPQDASRCELRPRQREYMAYHRDQILLKSAGEAG